MSLGEILALPNMVGLWRYQGNSDNAGSGPASADATIDVTFSQANGKFNQGAGFDGITSQIQLPDHADFKPTGAFSAGSWIKTSTSGQHGIIQSYSQNFEVAGIRLYKSVNNFLTLITGNNTGDSIQGTHYQFAEGITALNDGKPHWCVGTWDTSHLRIFVDGGMEAKVAWATAPVYDATNFARIGVLRSIASDLSHLTGNLDETFLLNGTALAEAYVRKLHAHMRGKFLVD